MRALLTTLLLAAAVAVGSPHATTPTAAGAGPTVESAVTLSAAGAARVRQERKVIKQVNRKRARKARHTGQRCRALKQRTTLGRAARRHNSTMVAKNHFSHQTPGEASLGKRVTRAGYKRWRLVAENIALGYRDSGNWSPRGVVRAWMRSPGHRRNILDCRLRHIGVSLLQTGDTRWWTQTFGRKL